MDFFKKKTTDYDVKITEIESKIPSISGLATNSALTGVENKIPDVSSLVKKNKTDYDAKILDINLNILLQPIIIKSNKYKT